MAHNTPLLAIIVAGLVAAFLFGTLAQRLRLSPLIGYLVAGIAIGPFTPGFVGDLSLATQLAELGVVLLMFGVGLHFSFRDLMAVRAIAIPGALVQIGAAVAMGMGLAALLGWTLVAGFVFGLALSVASTVVLLRAMQDRRLIETDRGRVAVGWLIVEDLVMVLSLVMIPVLARGGDIAVPMIVTVAKVGAFAAFMLIVGRRVVPWMLHTIAHTGSRELFRLAVLATALGVAFGAAGLFGVSFALGAFFAGMILAESPFSQRAAQETLPLRDAFAVLFFVSVGMLFDPSVVVEAPLAVLATVAIIVFGKSIAAFVIVIAFGRSRRTAWTIAASLAQIGEFSFILASMGVSLQILPEAGRDLILAGAIFSIMLNPLLFAAIDRFVLPEPNAVGVPAGPPAPLTGHMVLVGFGRVGSQVGPALVLAGERLKVIEAEGDVDFPDELRDSLIVGNAASPSVLAQAELHKAKALLVAIPDTFESAQIVEQARALNPKLEIIARAHSRAEERHLRSKGATTTVNAEEEVARRMVGIATGGEAMDTPAS
ncbi:MAG: Kef family K(+) transporter [Altererythrobacter sp.]|nr:Kef family K(+) transporter [Altererythrobacter sp.]